MKKNHYTVKRVTEQAVMNDYLETAETLDFSSGRDQKESAFAPGVTARVCHGQNYKNRHGKRRNRSTIVISQDKL